MYVSRNVSPDILLAIAEVKGYLGAMCGLLEGAPPPTPPHRELGFAGIRGLVSLNRELAKGHEGNSLIVDNAELLKAQSIARIRKPSALLTGRPLCQTARAHLKLKCSVW